MKIIIALVVGIIIGHFGPIVVAHTIANGTAKVLTTTGKAIDSVNKKVVE